MIYYSDGVFPAWGFIIMFIFIYIAIKEYKQGKELKKSIEKRQEKNIKQEIININLDDKKDELIKDYLSSYNYKKY
ncbi:hypothetical protein [Campylobacter sp.]|uniref:hypothetical protein n=1 Tax=Campylobacter sp. TaxID=205 RepID=UPI002AA89AEB|nr:hypothetical protein [Campylobacter sp.]MCI7076678.1 hypothetical protein [Campylobacter sp.]